ncbi:unnamed protein product, partial [Closterium sp. Naga37s-1]
MLPHALIAAPGKCSPPAVALSHSTSSHHVDSERVERKLFLRRSLLAGEAVGKKGLYGRSRFSARACSGSSTGGNNGGNHGENSHSARTGHIHRVTAGLVALHDETGSRRFPLEVVASLKPEAHTNGEFREATREKEDVARTIGLTDAETGGSRTKLETTSLKGDALKREAEEAVLAIDVGTGGTKAAVVTWHGAVVASAFWPHAPPRGADDDVAQARQTAEQEPSDWWRAAAGAAGECLAQLDGRKGGSSAGGEGEGGGVGGDG